MPHSADDFAASTRNGAPLKFECKLRRNDRQEHRKIYRQTFSIKHP